MFTLERVRYKDILSIDALQIPGAQITCILGPSGSGKTTLLRLLNKLISPDEGTLSYNGQSLASIDAIALRREVVMLSQAAVTFPGTLRDNLLIGRSFAEMTPMEDPSLRQLLEDVHLAKKLDASAQTLSGGEKQRLALARVLAMAPEVLLLDEPSSSLDEETESIVIGTVVQYVRDHSKTLVMVTHSKVVSETYADIVLSMDQGRIIDKGVSS